MPDVPDVPDGYLSLDQGFPNWARLGSNQRPLACEASALPLSYAPLGLDCMGPRGPGGPGARSSGEIRRIPGPSPLS